MIRPVLFLIITLSLQPILAGGQPRTSNKIIDVNDLQMRVDKQSAITYRDLLGKFESGVEIRKGAELGEIVWPDGHRLIIEKVRALSFFNNNRKRLALIVHLRNPLPLRSGFIYTSALLVFHFSPPGDAELIQLKKLEDWLLQPSELDFLETTPTITLQTGKYRKEGFWLTTTKTTNEETLQKYSLFALQGKYLTEILSDLPPFKTSREKCEQRFKQTLDTIFPISSLTTGSAAYPELQINVLESPFQDADCPKASTESNKTLVYEAAWNGRFYQTKFLGDNKIGIAECDEYLEKYEICVIDKVPKAQIAAIRKSFSTLRQSWKKAAADENARRGLAVGCKAALDAARQAMAAYGCKW